MVPGTLSHTESHRHDILPRESAQPTDAAHTLSKLPRHVSQPRVRGPSIHPKTWDTGTCFSQHLWTN